MAENATYHVISVDAARTPVTWSPCPSAEEDKHNIVNNSSSEKCNIHFLKYICPFSNRDTVTQIHCDMIGLGFRKQLFSCLSVLIRTVVARHTADQQFEQLNVYPGHDSC